MGIVDCTNEGKLSLSLSVSLFHSLSLSLRAALQYVQSEGTGGWPVAGVGQGYEIGDGRRVIEREGGGILLLVQE